MAFKLHLTFKDRVGVVADVSALIAENDINIVSMEVEREDERADLYLEVEESVHVSDKKVFLNIFSTVPGLMDVRMIDVLPHENRENRFRVVLDNIKDGVISIDREGIITTINQVAKEIFNCRDTAVTGRDIRELDFPDVDILACLNGKEFSNVKKNMISGKGRYLYFATGRPIQDSSGRVIGAVEIVRDMQEVKNMAQSISQPAQITFSDFIGKNQMIEDMLSFAQKIAGTESIVALQGESGTGKELLARAIHTESGRKGLFIPVNCAALPASLLESELFGYVGGAFTGAHQKGKPGLFELADNGTIFLDEIAEMPLNSQAKILRVIQDKQVRRVGGSVEIPTNSRIITATNKNLETLVQEKRFREDLYYRINVFPIHIPPLKERVDDIPVLLEHFLFQLLAKLEKPIRSVTKQALDKLKQHSWPGNVRELKNVIERAAIFCDSGVIDAHHIVYSFEVGKNQYRQELPDPAGWRNSGSLRQMLNHYEKAILQDVMETSESIRKSAKILGISHTALMNKLKKYHIKVAR